MNTVSVIDLASFLEKKYEQAILEGKLHPPVDPNNCIDFFVRFMQGYFKENLPTQTFYLPNGFGISLPRGEHISFHPDQNNHNFTMIDSSVPVTTGQRGSSVNSGAIPVSFPERK